MNTLLIFFAFPIAIIIVSIVLQKLLHNPILVSLLIFSIFLILTFTTFDETFLIATLAYTILAFITAVLAKIFYCSHEEDNNNSCNCLNNVLSSNNNSENSCSRTASDNIKNDTHNCFNYTYNRYKNF